MQLHSVHRAKGDAAGFLRRAAAGDFQFYALFYVKLELLVELPLDAIPPEERSEPKDGLEDPTSLTPDLCLPEPNDVGNRA